MNVFLKEFMEKLGFRVEVIDQYLNFTKGLEYIRFTYSEGMNLYFIEVADSIEEAKKNMYEDGDAYSMSIPLNELVEVIKEDILKYYTDQR